MLYYIYGSPGQMQTSICFYDIKLYVSFSLDFEDMYL